MADCFHHTRQVQHVLKLLSKHKNIDPEYKYQLLMVKELKVLRKKIATEFLNSCSGFEGRKSSFQI